MIEKEKILGVVLAGGKGRRMAAAAGNAQRSREPQKISAHGNAAAPKPLTLLGGKPLLDYILARAIPQCGAIIINANGETTAYEKYRLPIVADGITGFAGPLAGVLAGMDYAAKNHFTHVMSFAGDAPFIPRDMVERLAVEVRGSDSALARAVSRGRAHPVFCLWPCALRDDLHRAMTAQDIRKIDLFTAGYDTRDVEFSAATDADPDPFFNINTQDDLSEAACFLP